MAKYGSGSFGFLLADGYDLMSYNAPQGVTFKKEANTEMIHGLGAAAEQPDPVGVSKYTFTQSGAFFDSQANTLHGSPISSTVGATAKVICFAVAGNSIGAPFVGCLGALKVSYEVLTTVGSHVKATADYALNNHAYEGQIVQHWATKTGDWNTDTLNTVVDYATDPSQVVIPITSNSIANPTVVTTTVAHGLTTGHVILISGVATSDPTINGEQTVTVISTTTFSVPVNVTTGGTGGSFVKCSTVNGAYFFQQVSACTGFTNFVGTFQDSADNVTYATLKAMTDNVTAPYAEALTNGAETVNRYVAFDGNVTGTGSITMMAGITRL
jgi:hypothetical protein